MLVEGVCDTLSNGLNTTNYKVVDNLFGGFKWKEGEWGGESISRLHDDMFQAVVRVRVHALVRAQVQAPALAHPQILVGVQAPAQAHPQILVGVQALAQALALARPQALAQARPQALVRVLALVDVVV